MVRLIYRKTGDLKPRFRCSAVMFQILNKKKINKKKSILDEKDDLLMGTPYTFDEGMSCHSTIIELFYFDNNFRRIAQWVRTFRL